MPRDCCALSAPARCAKPTTCQPVVGNAPISVACNHQTLSTMSQCAAGAHQPAPTVDGGVEHLDDAAGRSGRRVVHRAACPGRCPHPRRRESAHSDSTTPMKSTCRSSFTHGRADVRTMRDAGKATENGRSCCQKCCRARECPSRRQCLASSWYSGGVQFTSVRLVQGLLQTFIKQATAGRLLKPRI